MQSVIERVAEEIQESGRAAVEMEGTFTDLPGDEALLRQALVNLTRNAIEAAPADGWAGVRMQSLAPDRLELLIEERGLRLLEHDLTGRS